MEISSLEKLESQIEDLIVQYKNVRAARDQLALQVTELEQENSALKASRTSLLAELEDARASTSAKEEKVKAKVEELLAKIEGT